VVVARITCVTCMSVSSTTTQNCRSGAVGAEDDQIVELGVLEDDAALDEIVDDGLPSSGRGSAP